MNDTITSINIAMRNKRLTRSVVYKGFMIILVLSMIMSSFSVVSTLSLNSLNTDEMSLDEAERNSQTAEQRKSVFLIGNRSFKSARNLKMGEDNTGTLLRLNGSIISVSPEEISSIKSAEIRVNIDIFDNTSGKKVHIIDLGSPEHVVCHIGDVSIPSSRIHIAEQKSYFADPHNYYAVIDLSLEEISKLGFGNHLLNLEPTWKDGFMVELESKIRCYEPWNVVIDGFSVHQDEYGWEETLHVRYHTEAETERLPLSGMSIDQVTVRLENFYTGQQLSLAPFTIHHLSQSTFELVAVRPAGEPPLSTFNLMVFEVEDRLGHVESIERGVRLSSSRASEGSLNPPIADNSHQDSRTSAQSVLSGSGDYPPPAYGDWLISSPTVVQNEVIVLNGNLIIQNSGNLTLRNVILLMNCSSAGQFRIEVQNSGILVVEANSNITALDKSFAWYLKANAWSTVRLQDSALSYAGWQWGTSGDHCGLWINAYQAEISNCDISNNYIGIFFYQTSLSLIANNRISNSGREGIYLLNSEHNIIEDNIITNSYCSGMYLTSSFNSTVFQNTVINSGLDTYYGGIILCDSPYSIISTNYVFNSGAHGINVTTHPDSVPYPGFGRVLIIYNNVTTSAFAGIYIAGPDDSIIANNFVTDCGWYGLHVGYAQNCNVTNNGITNNNYGAKLSSATNTHVTGNSFSNNNNVGLEIDSSSSFNQIYQNNFRDNYPGAQAIDNNGSNLFYRSGLGNHWGNNYTGTDGDGDGIGDTSYAIGGSGGATDDYPLMYPTYLGLPPTIAIISPLTTAYFTNTIWVNLTGNAVHYWYSLAGPSGHGNVSWTGIVQEAGLIDGTYTLFAYGNSTKGLIRQVSVTFTITSTGPAVIITSPIHTIYSTNTINVTLAGIAIHYWYFIAGVDSTNQSWTSSALRTLADGNYILNAYGNDSSGNESATGVSFTIDTTPPTVTITSPLNITYTTNMINVSLSGDAAHYWYWISGMDTMDQPWTTKTSRLLPNGKYALFAYGNDSVGNENSTWIAFTIDAPDPIIVIESPENTTYSSETITVTLSGNVVDYWYFIEGIDTTNKTWTTSVERTLSDGTYTLYAYGNDLVGQVSSTWVTFSIDIAGPTVVIVSPINMTYSRINITLAGDAVHYWYYIEGFDTANQSWTGSVERILPNGFYTLYAYGNDSMGNEAWTAATFIVDTIPPIVTILSPLNITYTTNTITISLSGNAAHYWYWIGPVDPTDQPWTGDINRVLPDGTYGVFAYGNDSAGNVNSVIVVFTIDTTGPTVTIESPASTTYTIDPVTIALSGDATHYWYFIEGVDAANQSWTDSITRSLADGIYTLFAFGNDSGGNEGKVSVVFVMRAHGTGQDYPPSPTGDWVIDSVVTVWNTTITLNGNLLILAGGSLTLHNVDLLMNCSAAGQFRIEVQNGGMLVTEANSNITTLDKSFAWYLKATAGSTVRLQDSAFSYAGWEWGNHGDRSGLWINTNWAEISNCVISHNFMGIYLCRANLSLIANNRISNSAMDGICLYYSWHNIIEDNIITNSHYCGISLAYSFNCTVFRNTVVNSGLDTYWGGGIILGESPNSIISTNIVINSGSFGINATSYAEAGGALIINNNVTTCAIAGIVIFRDDDSIIVNNVVADCEWYGVLIEYAQNCNVTNNVVMNSNYGAMLSSATNTHVTGNSFSNNNIGLELDSSAYSNHIYQNNFIDNFPGAQAIDNNGSNLFYWGSLGNHWGNNYTGTDGDGDGIGDTPYAISGSGGATDDYPLMYPTYLGLPPSVTIISPLNTVYSTDTIWVNLTGNAVHYWYSLAGPSGHGNVSWTGAVQEAGLIDGTYTLVAYGNSTTGLVRQVSVTFTITSTGPAIIIVSPISTIYSTNTINVTLAGDTTHYWYFIEGVDVANHSWTASVLRTLADGNYVLNAYGNDSSGIEGWTAVTFTIDTTPPSVTILSPMNITYTTNTITISLSGNAANYWYKISPVDSIDQPWTGNINRVLPDGTYSVLAYGNDSVGNVNSTWVVFTIDTTGPTVTISSPMSTTYAIGTITVSLSGDATHYWYFIEGVDLANQSWTTNINRSLADGTYTLNAYGNDSVGNEGWAVVTFTIDTTPPSVTILSPLNITYTTNTITISLSGDASHYWYQISGIDTTDQPWTANINRVLPDGQYTIYAYGNDSVGNVNSTWLAFTIDVTGPTVAIESPANITYTSNTVTIALSGDATHYWYFIVGVDGVNQSWTNNVERTLADGTYGLYAYGNDSVGNIGIALVIFSIDTIGPAVTISSPMSTTYTNGTITIGLSGDATHYWHFIEGVDLANQSWTANIDRSLADGTYTLNAYGNDSVGNEGWAAVTFTIDTTPPIVTLLSPMNITYTTNTITISLSGDATHYWYWIAPVDPAIQPWTADSNRVLPDGNYAIYAYGNDSAGNENSAWLAFTVDTTGPTITIESPVNTTYTSHTVAVALSGDATHYWYFIEGVDVSNQSWTESLARILADGTYTLFAFGNDSVGNEGKASITFAMNAHGTGQDYPPPPTGDWVIDSVVTVWNTTITLNGNLLILAGGSLTLHNVTLQMNCAINGQYRIEIYNGGSFRLEEYSSLTSSNASFVWYLEANNGSIIQIISSLIRHSGYSGGSWGYHSGIRIQTNEAQINSSLFLDNYIGIFLLNANDILISNNTINNSSADGIMISDSENCRIIDNSISNVSTGIVVLRSGNTIITDNFLSNGSYMGIRFIECSLGINLVSNNIVKNFKYTGIYFYKSTGSVVLDNHILGSSISNGIFLSGSGNATILRNTIADRGAAMILHSSGNTVISDNTIRDCSHGILHQNSADSTISNNSLLNLIPSNGEGILVSFSNNTSISNCIVLNFLGDYGIYIVGSYNITAKRNTITGAMRLTNISNSTIIYNLIMNPSQFGIYLTSSNNNNISYNGIRGSSDNGFYLHSSSNNNILSNNNITESNGHGLYIYWHCSNNTITDNTITSNSNKGIFVAQTSGSNLIYRNNIYDNAGAQSRDDNGTNLFYQDGLGNYWGNAYAGIDANGDGIGDSSFSIDGSGGAVDEYPLMQFVWLGLPPAIIISSPLNITYGTNTLWVNLTGNAIHYWYSLSGPTGHSNISWTGNIQEIGLIDGIYTLGLYGNSTTGLVRCISVVFTIDTTPPLVTILSPMNITYTSGTVTVTLSGDATHYWYFIEGFDTFNQTWDGSVGRTLPDGTYVLHAYGNDSAGNEAWTTIVFSIDTIPPIVTILSPMNITYMTNTITINLSGDATQYWYFIEGVDATNHSWTETISRQLIDGAYILHAFGNDSIGLQTGTSVIFSVDLAQAISESLEYLANQTELLLGPQGENVSPGLLDKLIQEIQRTIELIEQEEDAKALQNLLAYLDILAKKRGTVISNETAEELTSAGLNSFGLIDLAMDDNITFINLIEAIFAATDEQGNFIGDALREDLTDKLRLAIEALESGDNDRAVNVMLSFIDKVSDKRGNKISEVDAAELIAFAEEIICQINS